MATDPSMAMAGQMPTAKVSADHTTDLILQLPMAAGFALLVRRLTCLTCLRAGYSCGCCFEQHGVHMHVLCIGVPAYSERMHQALKRKRAAVAHCSIECVVCMACVH
jgi:hypothetical protein